MNLNSVMADDLANSPNPRTTMIGILNQSKVAPPLKIMGYAFLNAANENDILRLRDMFIKVIGYIENKDLDGLKVYLASIGINSELIKMMLGYVATNTNTN